LARSGVVIVDQTSSGGNAYTRAKRSTDPRSVRMISPVGVVMALM
jgi:hypothetical protein